MGKALALRSEYRLQQWAKIAEECAKSGISNREFLAGRGIPEKSYYYWLRRLREAAADAMTPQLVEVRFNGSDIQSGALSMRYQGAELMITETTAAAALDMALKALKKL